MTGLSAKRKAIGATVAVAIFAVLAISVLSVNWADYTESDVPNELPTFVTDDDDSIYTDDSKETLREDSLAYSIFEKYGIIMVPLAVLLLGAMIGGVVISREEVEHDDSN